MFGKPFYRPCHAFDETTVALWHIEDGKLELQPTIMGLLLFDDGHSLLKTGTTSPEFSLDREWRPITNKSLWRIKPVAIFGQQLLTIPVTTDTIKLFTHQPPANINLWRINPW